MYFCFGILNRILSGGIPDDLHCFFAFELGLKLLIVTSNFKHSFHMSDSAAVIFDMDGVLVHSNPAHKKAIQIFCERHGREVSEAFMEKRLFGRTNKEWIPELFGELDAEELQRLADEKERLFRDLFDPEENVVEGIRHFLRELGKRGIPAAVATSAPRENADYILSRLSIEDYFEVVLDSSHVNRGKPDPEVYLKASDILQRDPASCVVFEDSVSGVEAARRAGTRVVGVTTTHSEEELRPCSLLIENFVDLQVERLLNLPANPQRQ